MIVFEFSLLKKIKDCINYYFIFLYIQKCQNMIKQNYILSFFSSIKHKLNKIWFDLFLKQK